MYKFISCFLFSLLSLNAFAAVEKDPLDRAIYVECNSCESLTSFKNYALNDFNNRFYSYKNQLFSYTVVNHNSKKAVFINIQHKYRLDREGYELDVVIPSTLTSSGEMFDDYLLSRYVLRNSTTTNYKISKTKVSLSTSSTVEPLGSLLLFNDAETVQIELNSSIHDIGVGGLSAISGQISSALSSHTNSQSWAKLSGRAVIIIKFSDGKLAAFFASIYSTKPYMYLDGSAVDEAGNLINLGIDGAAASSGSGGGGGVVGNGSWIVGGGTGSGGGGGIVACTGIHGEAPVCTMI
ncbi:MAG: hypothetical protein ACI88H_003463 [Cocleimonas sp.]|jgi:hypothetical protein